MTGYGIGEYIRNRRLYQAALDLKNTDDKVIDIAYAYCYETPESFTKAFSRFHGVAPSQVRDGASESTVSASTISERESFVFLWPVSMPEALQSLNTQIFKEWLPGNPDYELCGNASAEWYDCVNGEKTDKDYHSAIWIPVKKND